MAPRSYSKTYKVPRRRKYSYDYIYMGHALICIQLSSLLVCQYFPATEHELASAEVVGYSTNMTGQRR